MADGTDINVPEAAPEDSVEDLQSADFDIRNLQKKFIVPIDEKRSSALAGQSRSRRLVSDPNGIPVSEFISRQLEDVAFDPLSFTESRVHAFYRVLGLPVMDASGNIFNPGFDPDLTIKQKERNQKLISNISEEILDIMDKREQEAIRRKIIFENQTIDATTFALVLPIVKPFNVMLEGVGPIEKDEQSFDIVERQSPFNPLTTSVVKLDGSDVDNFFSSGTHILKPFITDPRVVLTVLPDSNQICAPFLKDIESTKLDCERTLQRPGIEEICRLRLRQVKDNESFAANALARFAQTGSVLSAEEEAQLTTVDGDLDIKQAVLALLGKNEITQSELEREIQGLTSIEFLQIDKLTKSMKSAIDQLASAICEINKISRLINWFPAPDRRGPEFGSSITQAFIRYVNDELNSPIDNAIRELSLKSYQASQSRDPSTEDIGTFALPYMENATQDTFDVQLKDLTEQREKLGLRAGEQLAVVEIVTGEVSGLGLIDILAIYTALWAIPIEALISLLDDNAFERLYVFNPELRTAEVQERRQLGESTIEGDEALRQLENKVINLLKFADQLFKNAQKRNFSGGEIT